jgi:hypothetical protein
MNFVEIARCSEHGLHGERQECFVCGGPVEQIQMVPKADLEDLITFCKRVRKGSVINGRQELEERGWQSELGYHHVQFDVLGSVLKRLGEQDDLHWIRDVYGIREGAA